jgi:hypothetical protein
MPIRKGTFASNISSASPTVVLSAATNFNESRATLNATVTGNLYSTTVRFQYNTTNNFSSFTEVNAATTPIIGQNISSYVNITGLSANTTYYFRCVVSNDMGTTISSTLSFATWSLKTYANGTAGSYSLTIPTITPTGGSTVIPTVYNMFIFGGGGGSNWAGGGGGGYRLLSSRAFTSTANNVLSLDIGGGGSGNTTGNATGAGGTTSISASNFTTLSAGGGEGGNPNGNGGNVGFGDNPAYSGGAYFNDTSKFGSQYYGGGGGIGGGARVVNPGYGAISGGHGGTAYGYSGGAGGRGTRVYILEPYYGEGETNGDYWKNYGSGGQSNNDAGSAGLIYFQYYGP